MLSVLTSDFFDTVEVKPVGITVEVPLARTPSAALI
jgi:hypothetical protein